MTILRQADFIDRNNFADFLNRTGRQGLAVEVGTHRADFAQLFLDNWHGKTLFCVDPWEAGYDPTDPAALGDREADHARAVNQLALYYGRAMILRERSATAVVKFDDDSLDFVYIDGNHQPEFVRFDLWHWWHKVRPGGVIAGHDFLCHGDDKAHEYIQPVVFDFAVKWGLDVWLVVEKLCQPWSFYLEKP